MEDVSGGGDATHPEVDITATDSSTLDGYSNLAFLEILASLDVFEGWLCFGNPQVVSGVGVDSDIWLGGLCVDLGGGCRHVVQCTEDNNECFANKNMIYMQRGKEEEIR